MANIFVDISIISGFFPLFAAAFNYRDLANNGKILTIFFLIALLADLTEILTKTLGIINNMPLIHVFIVISIFFLGYFYYDVFFSALLKKIAVFLSTLVLVVVLYNAIHIWSYPSISNTISGLLFIVLSVLYFAQLLTRQEFIHIEKQGSFWINAGILFYYAVNIFLFMLLPRMISKNLGEFYMIHSITNIIANLLYSIGLLCKPQTTT
jgi:hypothetical protein